MKQREKELAVCQMATLYAVLSGGGMNIDTALQQLGLDNEEGGFMYCKECGRLKIEDGYCAICDGISSEMNLCDYCEHDIPTCPGKDIEYGNGIGNDNIIKCSSFKR